MVKVGGQPSSGLSGEAQLDLSQDSGSAIQEHSQRFSETTPCYFSCVLGISVLLEGKPLAHSEVVNTLEKFFVLDVKVFGCIHLSFNCNSCTFPAAEKHPHSMMLPWPGLTVGMVLDKWWAVSCVFHTYTLVSSDQRIFFLSPSGVHPAINPLLVERCSDGFLSTTLSHLPAASLELSQSDLWVPLYLSHQGSFTPDAQFKEESWLSQTSSI